VSIPHKYISMNIVLWSEWFMLAWANEKRRGQEPLALDPGVVLVRCSSPTPAILF
jgi:hypothetical protein